MNVFYAVIFLLIHLGICFVYSRKLSQTKDTFLFYLLFSSYLPLFGIITIEIIRRQKRAECDGDKLSYIDHEQLQENMFYLKDIDVEKELGKVSVEEALKINDYSVRRKVIMNTMQDEDIIEYLRVLKEALLNEDTETVHYASAVIMETQRKINDMLIKMNVKFKENPEDTKNLEEYEDVLNRIIFSGLYEESNMARFYQNYRELSDYIIYTHEKVKEKYYFNRINIDFKNGDLVSVKEILKLYNDNYSYSENMIVSTLKYCVKTCNKEALTQFIENVKEKKIKLSDSAMQYIKFFNE